MLVQKFIRKVIPIFFIIVLGILMFWDKGENFLTPNTFNNVGDTGFPLNIDNVNGFLYSWDRRGNYGLGQANFFPVHLPMHFSVLLWSILGLPLWIANRLWHVLPNILIGIGAFYLYRSLFKSKYSWICGAIASAFIMLLPDRNIFPHGSMGFAGSLFFLGALIRGLFSGYPGRSKKTPVIIFSLGIAMAACWFRCLYIGLLISGIIFVLSIYYFKKQRQNLIPIFKFIGSCIILALLLNLFWIIPLSLQLTHGRESLVPTSKILEQRETFYKVHQKMTNPAYILRATTGGSGLGRPSHYYFSHPLILPFSFLIPLYCFLPLLLKNVGRKIKLLIFSSVLLTLYPVSFHISPTINMFLRNHIPTFWIMNDPTYWPLYVGVCYGLVIGSMTEHFLKLMKDDKAKKVIFAGCVSIVVIIFGGGVLLDRPLVPKFYGKYSLYGNKLPYVKIPEEYDRLEEYLSKNARTSDRVWYINTGNYKRYTWSYEGHMPEILFFKSPIPAVGRPLTYATAMIDLLSKSVNPKKNYPDNDLKFALLLGEIMNLRYVLIHKDYFGKQDIYLNKYVGRNIRKNSNFKVVMDTDKFTLYENRDCCVSPIYPSRSTISVVGNVNAIK